jgi:4-hydroxyacetophenone monooxygenase
MRYISKCLDELAGSGARSMEPKPELYEAYHEKHQELIKQMVWSHPSITHTHFRNDAGEIHTVSPFRLVDYWEWTREINVDDYILS